MRGQHTDLRPPMCFLGPWRVSRKVYLLGHLSTPSLTKTDSSKQHAWIRMCDGEKPDRPIFLLTGVLIFLILYHSNTTKIELLWSYIQSHREDTYGKER